MRKRSEFEHKINARGPQASDFARYAEYEMNLDTLRKKRIKRLGVKSPMYTGQRRIFFILERGTKKLHGDLRLWLQYIEYARKQKAHKKLSQILMNVLRLHPTKYDLWVYAARYVLEDHADMTQARSYMQRGLRFCKDSKMLWIQYAKLEMIHIARITARQRILGLDKTRDTMAANLPDTDDPNADMIALPQVTEEDINPSRDTEDDIDEVALQNLNATPALTGAIPIAIFDFAMTHFDNDDVLGRNFYDMISEFDSVSCMQKILEHIVESLMSYRSQSSHTWICYIKFPAVGIHPTSSQFPRALGASIGRIKECQHTSSSIQITTDIHKWLHTILQTEGLDPALQKVITATIRSMETEVSSQNG